MLTKLIGKLFAFTLLTGIAFTLLECKKKEEDKQVVALIYSPEKEKIYLQDEVINFNVSATTTHAPLRLELVLKDNVTGKVVLSKSAEGSGHTLSQSYQFSFDSLSHSFGTYRLKATASSGDVTDVSERFIYFEPVDLPSQEDFKKNTKYILLKTVSGVSQLLFHTAKDSQLLAVPLGGVFTRMERYGDKILLIGKSIEVYDRMGTRCWSHTPKAPINYLKIISGNVYYTSTVGNGILVGLDKDGEEFLRINTKGTPKSFTMDDSYFYVSELLYGNSFLTGYFQTGGFAFTFSAPGKWIDLVFSHAQHTDKIFLVRKNSVTANLAYYDKKNAVINDFPDQGNLFHCLTSIVPYDLSSGQIAMIHNNYIGSYDLTNGSFMYKTQEGPSFSDVDFTGDSLIELRSGGYLYIYANNLLQRRSLRLLSSYDEIIVK
ncbi:MAG: hypothetical protein KDC37_02105 [Flavobacteriales bacterium]|nr:hypothetical protein [Flavobacteriales bacterium]